MSMGWGDAVKAAVPCVLAVALTCPAGAATITMHEPDAHGRIFVDLVGKIEPGDAEVFQSKTGKILPTSVGRPKIIVTLVSSGGNTNAALQIADLIRRNVMSTFVPGDRTCTSACALIWLAGLPRMVGDTPRIGFHATYDEKTRRETGVGNAIVGAYLRDVGMSYKAITFMSIKGPSSVNWLTPDSAKDFGINWTIVHPPRTSSIPQQPKYRAPPPPPQVAAEWTRSTRSAARSSAPQQLPSVAEPARQQTRVFLYEEDPADRFGRRLVGHAIWRTGAVSSGAGQAPEIAVRCDVEIPERRLAVTMTLRRNADRELPASHSVEIMFNVAPDFPFGDINNVLGILTKQTEMARGKPLSGAPVKLTSGSFLLGLSATEKQRNLELLREGAWLDIPVVYSNGRRAIIAVEKGTTGARALNEAFAAWGRDTGVSGRDGQPAPVPATITE
jgi:hypothetical protein